MMAGKRILLIIGGGIAAYKSLELIRRLTEREVAVKVILTRAGAQFVTPLAVASLSRSKVHDDLFSLTDEAEMGHIELSRSADLLVVAPATADLMAKMATGQANDLATTALLATDKPVLIAPAMNVRMWNHPATQRNLARLKSDGVLVCGPDEGRWRAVNMDRGGCRKLPISWPPSRRISPARLRRRRLPAGGCWSPPDRPMSPSIRCATSPIALLASRAMR
jgi:phosphopantothenoylcysteine decarboxylase/phosphopantothenate--cysteine ligase